MKYLFILGRNHELSIAEIEEYLDKIENPIKKLTQVNNGLLVEVENPLLENTITYLGGTISIGEILTSGTEKLIFEKLDKIMIYLGENNKLTYTLWDFSEIGELTKEYLKQRFKEEKLKATFKGLTGKIKNQEGEKDEKPSSKLIEEEYFIFQEEGIEYFGKITEKCDYESIENRDMNKPVRRESLAISPRLAKILINLAKLKTGDKLLDPFCGVGGIMQEALLQNMTALGVDNDGDAIKGAQKNLEWFGFSPESYELIHFDSTKVSISPVTAVATEPDLRNILKKIPTKGMAENTLKDFEKLIVQVINNVKKMVEGRIVFTSPYIRIGKKRLSCNIENICERTGYHEVRESLPEFRENQVVGRMIYVLEKN